MKSFVDDYVTDCDITWPVFTQASCERTALCVWRHRHVCSTALAAPPMRLPIPNPNPNANR